VNGTRAEDVFAAGTAGVYLAEPESKSRRIVIDQIRALEHSLQIRAADGRRKGGDCRRRRSPPTASRECVPENTRGTTERFVAPAVEHAARGAAGYHHLALHPIPLAAKPNATPSPEEAELVELLAAIATPQNGTVQNAYRLAQGFQRLLARVRETIQAKMPPR
jgi:hypothetical protein